MSWMNESTATKLDYISLALRHPKQPSLSADPYWQSAPNFRTISTDSSNTGRSWFEHSVHAGNVLMFIVSIGWYHIEHLLFSKEKPESRAETGLKLGPRLPSAHPWPAGCRGLDLQGCSWEGQYSSSWHQWCRCHRCLDC